MESCTMHRLASSLHFLIRGTLKVLIPKPAHVYSPHQCLFLGTGWESTHLWGSQPAPMPISVVVSGAKWCRSQRSTRSSGRKKSVWSWLAVRRWSAQLWLSRGWRRCTRSRERSRSAQLWLLGWAQQDKATRGRDGRTIWIIDWEIERWWWWWWRTEDKENKLKQHTWTNAI